VKITEVVVEKTVAEEILWLGGGGFPLLPSRPKTLSARFRVIPQRARCWLWAGQSDLKTSNSPDLLISFHISFKDRSRTFPQSSPM